MSLEEVCEIQAERAETYGDPREFSERLGTIWGAMIDQAKTGEGEPLPGWLVMRMMAALKLLRLCQSPDHRDSHIDLLSYEDLAWKVLETNDFPPENSPLGVDRSPVDGESFLEENRVQLTPEDIANAPQAEYVYGHSRPLEKAGEDPRLEGIGEPDPKRESNLPPIWDATEKGRGW